MAARPSAAGVDGLSVEFREFAEEDHGTVVTPAAGRAIRFALDGRWCRVSRVLRAAPRHSTDGLTGRGRPASVEDDGGPIARTAEADLA